MEDLVIAVRRDEKGLEVLVNTANRQELEVALMRLTHYCYGVFNAMSHAAQQEAKKHKIVPAHGIMDFVRGGRKK